MELKLLDDKYKVIKLKPNENIPVELLSKERVYSITRTDEELSIVVRDNVDIESDVVEENWKIIKIIGTLDFSLIGILSKISTILANVNISIFAISTYNTDYILVKEDKINQAIKVLEENNYKFIK